jgi:hypothetical protein
VIAPVLGQFAFAGGGQVVVAPECLAAGGRVQAAEDVEQGRFPAARGPQQHDELALVDLDVQRAQRRHFHFSHVVSLGQAARDEYG